MENIPNVLAERYASADLKAIWSPRAKVILERTFWIAVMKAQKEMRIAIPEEAIKAYEKVCEKVDLESLKKRELVTHHDVKAGIDEFCELAGYQHIHKGMTSRDLTENVEQLQVYRSLLLIRKKAIAALLQLAKKAAIYKNLSLTARTHNVAAQMTTFGKRLAMYGEELLKACERLQYVIENYSFRGLKGGVGTQLDQIYLLNGDVSKARQLDEAVLKYLGAPKGLNAVGQIYPRGLDFEVVSALCQIAGGPSSFALTLRLMAGDELISEGLAEGQVGSSAMPHKINSKSCERIHGFKVLLSGYLAMVVELVGDQWNEGDVSCSVVRRVVLSDSFYVVDGLLDTFITILLQMEVFEDAMIQESHYFLPFLLTTQVLMEAVKGGVGREIAHECIKAHAVATVKDLRSGTIGKNDFFERLEKEPRLKLKREQLAGILEGGLENVGAARAQVEDFIKQVEGWVKQFPEAEGYKPATIL